MLEKFEWDIGKSRSNKTKHGLDFEEAKALWDDPHCWQSHLEYITERRWILIGKIHGRYWSAFFTMREDCIRLISVRRSRKDEKEKYEEQKQKNERA